MEPKEGGMWEGRGKASGMVLDVGKKLMLRRTRHDRGGKLERLAPGHEQERRKMGKADILRQRCRIQPDLWKSSMQWIWLVASTVKGMPSRPRWHTTQVKQPGW